MEVKKIIIRRRTDDYQAFIEGQPQYWGCGKTIGAAVGDLVMSHREQFNIEIETE